MCVHQALFLAVKIAESTKYKLLPHKQQTTTDASRFEQSLEHHTAV